MDEQSVNHLRAFLESLGLDDTKDPELAKTPERVTKMFGELFAGVYDEAPEPSTFPPPKTQAAGDPVVIAAIPFQSMCVHHLLPFFGAVDVAYIPGDKMVGFGSIGRIVDHYAQRPQVQERMIVEIADHIDETIAPDGLLIRLRARQLCMEMRGAKKTGELLSLASRGSLVDGQTRSELLDQFKRSEKTL